MDGSYWPCLSLALTLFNSGDFSYCIIISNIFLSVCAAIFFAPVSLSCELSCYPVWSVVSFLLELSRFNYSFNYLPSFLYLFFYYLIVSSYANYTFRFSEVLLQYFLCSNILSLDARMIHFFPPGNGSPHSSLSSVTLFNTPQGTCSVIAGKCMIYGCRDMTSVLVPSAQGAFSLETFGAKSIFDGSFEEPGTGLISCSFTFGWICICCG